MNKFNKPLNEKIKTVASRSAKLAGEFLLKEFARFDRRQIKFKSHYEILTKADLGSEKIIINEIKKYFPEHHILSEESGSSGSQSDYLWIIDPLDGTTNFSIHNPIWAVSIALARKNEIIFGLVYAPYLGEFYLAEKNKGASKNGRKIKVSGIKGIRAVHTFCHGSTKQDIKRAIGYYQKQKVSKFDCRQLGSAATELAFVASGRTESIMIPGAHSWDIAAGVLLVKEAGGRVSDLTGRDWNLNSRDILASNGLVHKEILKIV